MHHTALIEDLAVVLCLAAIMAIIFQKIKQPVVLGYLIAGCIAGPYTPPFSLIDDEVEIKLLAQLGVVFLMFSLGLEFTYNKLSRLGLAAIIIAVFEVVFMLLLGFFAGQMLGWTTYENMLLGAALSISSTTIIIKALEELHLKRYGFAELMIGVLLIEDMLAILLLVYVSTVGTSEKVFSSEILFATMKLLLVITSWFLIGYFALPYLMKRIQKYINYETLTILAVGLCLGLSTISEFFDYSAALGAFIMGAILAETPLAHKIEELTLPIRDVFAAVFFVSVGMLIDPLVMYQYWPYIAILSLVTIIGKLIASSMGSLLAGQSVSDSTRIGFSMAQIGEFSFIIIGLGRSIAEIDETLYSVVVGISVITTFVTPYLIKFGMKKSTLIEAVLPQRWRDSLDKYRQRLFVEGEERHELKKHKRNKLACFVINGLIVAIIATICAKVVVPRVLPLVNKLWIYQFLFWLGISLLTAPFLWAMLFAHRSLKVRRESLENIMAWLVTIIELGIIILLYFRFPLVSIPIVIVMSGCFLLFRRQLKRTYAWLERHLISNLARRQEIDEALMRKLAPWDNSLVKIKVSDKFPFVGQTLEESQMRPESGINIVAIKRVWKTVWLPDANERILPNDELMIVAENEEIEKLNAISQSIEELGESVEPPEMKEMMITENHILIGHALSDSIVKEHVKGLVVGLDRNGDHILNPAPDTILKEGDLLFYISRTS